MEKRMKFITIGGVALLVLCLILGFALTYKGTPKDAKELLTYASELMDETKYVSGKINCEIVGVQEEQNIDVNIKNEYTYDVRTNVCNAKLKYETKLGESEITENIYIWNVGEKEKDETVYYAYTQTEEEKEWYKEKITKTNDEIYRLNVFSLILQNKSELKLQEKTKKINDEDCYVVEAKISAKVADSEKDGLAVVMEKAIFEQEYKEFKSFKKLNLPDVVKKDAVLLTTNNTDEDTETSENEMVFEYPLLIIDENTSSVEIKKIKNLVIDNESTTGDYAKFYLDNIEEYNYVEAYTYNYTWAETDEQALKLLLESVSNLEQFLNTEEEYTDVTKSEIKNTKINDRDVYTVDMTYKYDKSLFHQTDAFIKIQDKEYLRVTIVVVTDFEEKNPVDTDAFIEKFIKAMTVVSQEEVTK